jgi:hypothetical integral membrane protein (TIGR02206 family)
LPLFGTIHVTLLVTIALACWLVITLCRRGVLPFRAARWTIGLALAANEIVWWVWRYSREGVHMWNLPLQLCDMTGWLSVLACLTLAPTVIEFAYFAGIAGAGMALIAPDLWTPWPTYPAVCFFISHGLIVMSVTLLAFGGQYTFRAGAVRRSFGLLLAYAALVGTMNALFHANYMYLRQKPAGASPLDWFGPWPWYLVAGGVAGFVLFSLLGLLVRKPRMVR